MKRTRFGLTALALVLGFALVPCSQVNSQEVPVADSGVEIGFDQMGDGPEILDQVAELPGGDAFAMRMRHGSGGGMGVGMGMGMGMGSSCPYLEGENKLTDEQFEKFYLIKNRMKDDMGSKMLEMGRLRRQFCDELNRESIDTKAVSKLEDRMAALKGETSKVFTTAALDMMNVLTPEQRKILRQKMIRGSSMCGGMQRMGHRSGMSHCPGMMRPPHHMKGGDK